MTTSTRTYATKTSRLTREGYVYNEAVPAESYEAAVRAVIQVPFAAIVDGEDRLVALTDAVGTVHPLRPF